MAHTPQYLNGTVLQQVVSAWAHIFQARQFQGKGDPRFDVSLILNNDQKELLRAAGEQLAVSAFPNAEYNTNPQFAWPWSQTEMKTNSPKLGELFPGHWIISAKAYEDSPPQIMIPDNANPGQYIPMPDGMRAQLVFDGALCYAGIDLASYVSGQNIGIRVQVNFIVYYGAGTKVAIGARPDTNQGMTGINVQMQTPQGINQMSGGAANISMPVQTGQVQQQPNQQVQTGQVQQQPNQQPNQQVQTGQVQQENNVVQTQNQDESIEQVDFT